MAVTHASKLRHGGATITKGTRYILVGFMQVCMCVLLLLLGSGTFYRCTRVPL